jgi:hypothetical protein
VSEPVLNSGVVQSQTFFTPRGNRVEKTDTFNVTTIPLGAAIRYDNMVKGPFLGTAPGQAYRYHKPCKFL